MTHNSKWLLLLNLGIFLVVGCSKNSGDNPPELAVPTITTESVTSVTKNSATCGGNVTSDGGATVTARGVVWGTSQNPTVEKCMGMTIEDGSIGVFTSFITGLSASSTYFVRAYAINSVGIAYGEQKSFTTLNQETIPTVTTADISIVTESSATCGGNVTSDGGATVTARGVVWGTSQNPTIEQCIDTTIDGSGTGNFTSNISGLDEYGTYYVRAYATNSKGTVYGKQQFFTTKSSGEAVDLSEDRTANCYIVSKIGKYKFKATVKGGSTQSIGTPASAEVLWESFGTDVTPSIGQIITNASYSNDTITFYTFPQFNDGNAVIAAKDASGKILWSWHIWLCEDFNPVTTAQKYNNDAGIMMDRNLGATSAEKGSVGALGLLYQWGRKDPFLASSAIKSGTKAKSTGSWPSNAASVAGVGTFEYVESHPMQFITQNVHNFDWYYTGDSSTDNTRWKTSDNLKGLYDPCPAGWRVPDGGPKESKGVWAKAFDRNAHWKNALNWDGRNRGMDFGNTDTTLIVKGSGQCWYPAAGYLDCNDASLDDAGYDGGYWSCTPSGYYAYFLYILSQDGIVSPSSTYYAYRSYAQSVRCVKE